MLVASAAGLLYMFSDATAETLLSVTLVYSVVILYVSSIWGGFSKRGKIIKLLVCLAFPAYFSAKFLLWSEKATCFTWALWKEAGTYIK